MGVEIGGPKLLLATAAFSRYEVGEVKIPMMSICEGEIVGPQPLGECLFEEGRSLSRIFWMDESWVRAMMRVLVLYATAVSGVVIKIPPPHRQKATLLC